MKPEHWKALESVVGTSLNLEELNVAFLEEINIFSHGMEIQEVTHIMSFCCYTCDTSVFVDYNGKRVSRYLYLPLPSLINKVGETILDFTINDLSTQCYIQLVFSSL